MRNWRVRRALDSLPTVDQLENLGSSKRIGSLHDVWTQSDPADQRDLLRLRVREVQGDVVTGRAVSLLSEREFGVFVPTRTAVARSATLDEVLDALRDSLDAVSTRYLLWDRVFNASQPADPADLPKALAAVLTTGACGNRSMFCRRRWRPMGRTLFSELWE